MKRFVIIGTLLFSAYIAAQAQEIAEMGVIFDPVTDSKVQLTPTLLTRDYEFMPSAYSIKNYCPTPKSQSRYGTCTSWATTYAARTICEAVKYEWTDRNRINQEAFSPIFIFLQAKSGTINCSPGGSSIQKSLEILKEKGSAKLQSFNVLCAEYIPPHLFSEAVEYRIEDFTCLFMDKWNKPYNKHSWAFDTPGDEKIRKVKKAIVEKHPVVIDMDCYMSFSLDYKKDLWEGITRQDSLRGGHALCVVGYDDNKYGGAFEIMNSWGEEWGNKGFLWVTYADFCRTVKYAFDVYAGKKIPQQKKYNFSGKMFIRERDGGGQMALTLKQNKGITNYRAKDSYLSGKKFHLYVSNNEPAWVYVIESDQKNNVTKLFPSADNISAHLTYSSNNFAIPDEKQEFQFDTSEGTDYFCVFYSQKELDINKIINDITRTKGTFYEKIRTVIGNDLVPVSDIQYDKDHLGFSAKSDKTLVPLIVEIPHDGIPVKQGSIVR